MGCPVWKARTNGPLSSWSERQGGLGQEDGQGSLHSRDPKAGQIYFGARFASTKRSLRQPRWMLHLGLVIDSRGPTSGYLLNTTTHVRGQRVAPALAHRGE